LIEGFGFSVNRLYTEKAAIGCNSSAVFENKGGIGILQFTRFIVLTNP
jgi:hypothetical protein